jgi:molybdopterin/thiamine biosynthesis adenylyltransferase
MRLRMSAEEFRRLHAELLGFAPAEGAAFLATERGGSGLLVRSAHPFRRADLETGPLGELVLTERAQIDALADLKRRGHGLVEVHTHPGSHGNVGFSAFDRQQLPEFARYVRLKLRGHAYGALVLGEKGYAGAAVGDRGEEPLLFEVTGEHNAVPDWMRPITSSAMSGRFDRQTRALGADGQRRLKSLRVGVVGLGGTGSQIAQLFAHVGCSEAVLVDDDRVERTNLPRLAGAAWWDPIRRRRKTRNARRLFRRVDRNVKIRSFGSLRSEGALEALIEVDLIIGCVDNDGARLILSELAAAYLVPYLDIGVGIEPGTGGLDAMGGRVGFYLPGGPCLACADELDFAEAAEDLETEALRRIRVDRGYARDRRVEAALMPLNTVLVGLAMNEVLAFATGVRRVQAFSRFDAIANQLVQLRVDRDADCPVCAPAAGMGDRQLINRYVLER